MDFERWKGERAESLVAAAAAAPDLGPRKSVEANKPSRFPSWTSGPDDRWAEIQIELFQAKLNDDVVCVVVVVIVVDVDVFDY